MTPQELQAGLAGFTGTEHYYPFSAILPNWVLTDGAKWLADNAGCFWLMDMIASHAKKIRDEGFAVVKLKKTSPNDCTVTIEDGNDGILAAQENIFTDFPLDEIVLYAVPGDERLMVIMLTSEY